MVFNGLAYGLLETIAFGWPCTFLMIVSWWAWKGDFKSSYNYHPIKLVDLPEDVATRIDKEGAKWLFYLGCALWGAIAIAWLYSLVSGDFNNLPYIIIAIGVVWVIILLALIVVFLLYARSLEKKLRPAKLKTEAKGPEIVKSNLRKSHSYLTIIDWLIEAAALAGFVVGLAVIYYGGSTEPAIVPTHLGGYGTIDNYGSKWKILGFYFITLCITYIALTIGNRYVYRYYNPAKIKDEKASRTNHFLHATIRTIKLIYLWVVAGLAAYYVNVLPDDPPKALGSVIISIVIFVPLIFVFLMIVGVNNTASDNSKANNKNL